MSGISLPSDATLRVTVSFPSRRRRTTNADLAITRSTSSEGIPFLLTLKERDIISEYASLNKQKSRARKTVSQRTRSSTRRQTKPYQRVQKRMVSTALFTWHWLDSGSARFLSVLDPAGCGRRSVLSGMGLLCPENMLRSWRTHATEVGFVACPYFFICIHQRSRDFSKSRAEIS